MTRPFPTNACVLHIGMPKTGSTSIQESLYRRLSDRRFHYVGIGGSNAGPCLAVLFSDRPQQHLHRRRVSRASHWVARVRPRFEALLRRSLRQARARARTPIISAEALWKWSPSELARLRDFIHAEGFQAMVVAYLRPIRRSLESHFQQRVRTGRLCEFDPLFLSLPPDQRPYSYVQKLATVEDVFGRESLTVRSYERCRSLEGGVVSDFSKTIGLAFDARRAIRVNVSMCVDAIRLLYIFNRYGPGEAPAGLYLQEQLRGLVGPPLRFHDEVFAPLDDLIELQQRAILDRYGVDLSDAGQDLGAGLCVRDETDLLRCSPGLLRWIGERASSAAIDAADGQAAGREIARQLERIGQQPPLQARLDILRRRIGTAVQRIRRGDWVV